MASMKATHIRCILSAIAVLISIVVMIISGFSGANIVLCGSMTVMFCAFMQHTLYKKG
jgi:hypothetical protein